MSKPFTRMRKALITEILFFLTAIVTSLITFHFAFGFNSIETESVLDINVHDTYFVIEKRELFPMFSLLILYLFYFIKVCLQKFKNRQTLWIFSILSLTTILIWPGISAFVKSLATEPSWTVYPPLSARKVEIKENIFNRIYPDLYFAYIALTMFGVFVFYKLGKLYKRHNS
jgi:heme/copper-type cytochrome/quinol oxidase subunit 1